MAKIELKNVTKSYGAVQVIKGIDLTIEKGESDLGAGGDHHRRHDL